MGLSRQEDWSGVPLQLNSTGIYFNKVYLCKKSQILQMPAKENNEVAQMSAPTMRETQVQSLGWEDPLEKEMATHSSTLAWKIPWTEERGRLQSMGHNELDMTKRPDLTSLQRKQHGR